MEWDWISFNHWIGFEMKNKKNIMPSLLFKVERQVIKCLSLNLYLSSLSWVLFKGMKIGILLNGNQWWQPYKYTRINDHKHFCNRPNTFQAAVFSHSTTLCVYSTTCFTHVFAINKRNFSWHWLIESVNFFISRIVVDGVQNSKSQIEWKSTV